MRGTKIQHETVEKLIEEIRAGGTADPEAYIQAYTVRRSTASLATIYSVFYELGVDINMYRDYTTGKLVVFGRKEEHQKVQDILEMFAPQKTELAVFPLVYVDANTAQQVFSMMDMDGAYVDARYDATSNQLYVTAPPDKLEEIRKVLIKMGEKDLEKMKPFATTGSKSNDVVESDGKRVYMRFDDPKEESSTDDAANPDDKLIDLTHLEKIEPPKDLMPKPETAPELTVNEKSGQIRTVTISGGDAQAIVNKALKDWNRENPVQVVRGDAGVVQTREDAPAPKANEDPKEPAKEPEASGEPKAPETPQPKANEGAPSAANAAAKFAAGLVALKGAGLLAPIFGGVVVYDAPEEPAPAPAVEPQAPATPVAEPVAEEAPTPQADQPAKPVEVAVPQAPGVYVVVNPDGSLMLSSSDEAALEEFQRRLASVVDEMKTQSQASANATPEAAPEAEPTQNAVSGDAESDAATNVDLSNPDSPKYLSYMTEENLAKARERVLLESRQYTVYKIENVGVSQIVPRLQTYMADRLNQNNQRGYGRYGGYGGFGYDYDLYDYYGGGTGITLRTMSNPTPLAFQPDVSLNTLMVYGTKADRDAVGAMIVLLDDVDLFPQPITKPYKIKVENTSTTRMAQQVLNAFQRKFQTTLMPGNLTPRISPNPSTNTIEVYAPEQLAQEIEEYVKEVDKEILEESVRKVRVIPLTTMNSQVLATYLANLRTQQNMNNAMLSAPYIGGGGMGMMGMYPQPGMNARFYGGAGNAAARARAAAMQAPGAVPPPAAVTRGM